MPAKPLRLLVALALFATLISVSKAQLPPPVRILPLGDSITFGSGASGGYRFPLYQLLTNAGYNVDFVGTQTGNGIAGLPDSDHEGHGGWRIDQIDSIMLSVFNVIDDPDIILLLIGTNDYGQGTDTANATNRLEGLIARMATNRPFAKIIVANLLERGEPYNTQIQTTFNPFVQSICERQHALGREVYFDDLRSAVPLSDMPDQLHPNATGYAKMATNWLGVITNHLSPYGTTNAPAISHVFGLPNWTNVSVTFSKPVADTAANPALYSMGGTLSVTAATLDPISKRVVTLTTSRQVPGSNYSVTVSGIRDRTAAQNPIGAGAAASFFAAPIRGAFNNIPEATNFTMIYSLDIPNSAIYGTPGYTLDNHANIGEFSRLGYYLELQQPGGALQYIWVSMDPFAADAALAGVPTGASFQQPLTNMNVLSTVGGIVNGNGLSGGNIEFWPSNYSQTNAANVPGASSTAYDWGDVIQAGGYGSMQIHNSAAGQVLFAFNHWGTGGGVVDLGIGNRPGSADADWTFANNASAYSIKTLQVLVQPKADATGPAGLRAVASSDLVTVRVYFSEPLLDNATNILNYYIEGLAISDAALDPVTRSVVTLTTAPQQPLTSYSIWFMDLQDRFGNQIDGLTPVSFTSSAREGVFANIPETAQYSLVYSLDIPATAMFNTTNVPYSVDLHSYVSNYSRIGYYLELQQNGSVNFVWVTVDPFTSDPGKIGVPQNATAASFQQPLTNMTVFSSVPGVLNVTNSSGGNMEFWPGNYSAPNASNVPNASATVYDWGDTMSTGSGHGSMQIHNNAGSQVVFAFNNWGGSGTSGDVDLGIGNNTGNTNPDWTFMRNGSTYSSRRLQVFVLPATTSAPSLLSAAPVGANTVILTFSQSLDDDATNASHYAIAGTTVQSAALDASKSIVTLTTTELQPATTYTVTVNGVKNRASAHNEIAPNSSATFQTVARSLGSVFANVPGAAAWTLAYSLQVPVASTYNSTGVLYAVDNHFGVTNFSRVAYYLELAGPTGPTNFIWVEMDPFSADASKLGVPVLSTATVLQQSVSNLTVFSSVPGILLGTNMAGGFIEFWPYDYTQANAANVPGANPNVFDFGDQVRIGTGGYGCMQIHNAAAKQTLLAFNNWGGTGGGNVCLGIGNNTSTVDPDWTHVKNGANYTVRNLQIYVLPAADTTPPQALSAVFAPDMEHIIVTFSEPLADNAATVANFDVSNTSYAGATLASNLRQAVLNTSVLNPGAAYAVSIQGIHDRSANANLIVPTNLVVTQPALPEQIVANVAESSSYRLVYKLNLPVVNPGLDYTGTVYDIDNHAFTGPFSRVAYYLELATNGGPATWVYVSMDAFTPDVNKIGVPDLPSGAMFQQKVTNMNVYSSQADLVTGAGITTGSIEFWGLSYQNATTGLIPTGVASKFDWNDATNNAFFGSEGYGSMQVHNYGAYSTGQVVFAYNNWGKVSGAIADLGIGSRPAVNDPDWTFANNGTNYVLKNLYVLVLPMEDTNAPTIVKATPSANLTNVMVIFSESVASTATNPLSYTLNGGGSILGATLRPNMREVMLVTTPLTPATPYTLGVTGIADRSTNGNVIASGASVGFTTPAVAPVYGRVAEAANYVLASYLAIPTASPNYNVNGLNYTADLRGSITQAFSRVAYYLELAATAGGTTNWVYVSCDAFTPMLSRIGVPAMGLGAGFQQKLTNMTVQSSVSTVATGTGIASGNIEFWPFNYSAPTNSAIPTGSTTLYDWNDTVTVATGGQYGSMQIHNNGANSTGQVVFAFNHWGAGQSGNIDVGIGSSTCDSRSFDYTFCANGGTYAVKNLYILVQPTPAVPRTGLPPGIVLQPQSRRVSFGDAVTLTVMASGSGPISYQWRLNGLILIGQTNSVLSIAAVQPRDIGAYDVVAANASGSVTSLVAGVTSNHLPIPGFHSLLATQNQALTITAEALLAKDSDPESEPLSIAAVGSTSTNGSPVQFAGGIITYTPATDYLGRDLFTYTLRNLSGSTAPAVVFVTVVTTNGPVLGVISAPKVTSTNTFHVRFTGIAGFGYAVEAAPTITGPWHTITNIVAPIDGAFDLLDPVTPPMAPERYYRVQPPVPAK